MVTFAKTYCAKRYIQDMCWHVFDGAYLRACSNYALTETVAANENKYVTDTSKHFEKQPLCC